MPENIRKFGFAAERTKKVSELWDKFAVSGVIEFNKHSGEKTLQSYTDLDGRAALGILQDAGLDTSDLSYIHPGETRTGAVNLDTGGKYGFVYDEASNTFWLDHHDSSNEPVTSTAEIVYHTMLENGLIQRSEKLDKLVEFVTKVDNRLYPAEEFLRSAKTLLGLQRSLNYEQLKRYFEDHESADQELTVAEWEKYGLKEVAESQQKIVDESMAKLAEMEEEGKVTQTDYGSILINQNNELQVGASAAYVRHHGILNISPGKSFALAFKDKKISEQSLKALLGERFQGKVIRDQIWLYNGEEPLELSQEDIVNVLISDK